MVECSFNPKRIEQSESVLSVKVEKRNRVRVMFNKSTITPEELKDVEASVIGMPYVSEIRAGKHKTTVDFEV